MKLRPTIHRCFNEAVIIVRIEGRGWWPEDGPISIVDVLLEGGHPPWLVRTPSWWERLLGITLNEKIIDKMEDAQAWCRERERILEEKP